MGLDLHIGKHHFALRAVCIVVSGLILASCLRSIRTENINTSSTCRWRETPGGGRSMLFTWCDRDSIRLGDALKGAYWIDEYDLVVLKPDHSQLVIPKVRVTIGNHHTGSIYDTTIVVRGLPGAEAAMTVSAQYVPACVRPVSMFKVLVIWHVGGEQRADTLEYSPHIDGRSRVLSYSVGNSLRCSSTTERCDPFGCCVASSSGLVCDWINWADTSVVWLNAARTNGPAEDEFHYEHPRTGVHRILPKPSDSVMRYTHTIRIDKQLDYYKSTGTWPKRHKRGMVRRNLDGTVEYTIDELGTYGEFNPSSFRYRHVVLDSVGVVLRDTTYESLANPSRRLR